MKWVYGCVIGFVLSQAFAGCDDQNNYPTDEREGNDLIDAAVDASIEIDFDSSSGVKDLTDGASKADANSPYCPLQKPQAGTSCSRDVSCSYSNITHIDCGLFCPPGCSGGGMYGVPVSPQTAVCKNGLWSVSASELSMSRCDKTPERDCNCADSGK
jgi:hypothetical protein